MTMMTTIGMTMMTTTTTNVVIPTQNHQWNSEMEIAMAFEMESKIRIDMESEIGTSAIEGRRQSRRPWLEGSRR